MNIESKMKNKNGPKILVLDIETSPIISYTWGLFDQNVALNQIHTDWHLLSVACKWLGDPPSKMMYKDQRNAKNIQDDRPLLKMVWDLCEDADIILTQNGISFDIKKLNARFIINGFKPVKKSKNIDTLRTARKVFGFTSNKLEYMTNKLCKKYKKLKHNKFSGFDLWKECLAGNKAAWNEMEKYNKYDVLALEELYTVVAPWDPSINFNLYTEDNEHVCNCGSKSFIKKGFDFTATGKFQRYKCTKCGARSRSRTNLFSKEKKKSLRA